MGVERLSLSVATQYCLQFLTYEELATTLGVTKDQVYKYASGKTLSPSNKVVDAFYDKVTYKGRKILISVYSTEEDYLKFRSMRDA